LKDKIFKKILNKNTDFDNNELKYITSLAQQGIIKQENNCYSLSKKYKIGYIKIQSNIAIVEELNSKTNIFVDLQNLHGAMQNDLVIVKVIFHPRGRLKAKVEQIVQRALVDILCYKNENKIFTMQYHSLIDIKENTLQNGDIFILSNSTIKKVLGNISNPSIDKMISLYLYNNLYRLDEYKLEKNINITNKTCVDLTHLPFCTIDPITAKDHDDAIYYDPQQKILYVAIADVSKYIQEGSTLDQEARKRGFSIYLPNEVLPMIPFELSADLCSLKPDVNRYAFVCKIYINDKKTTVTKSEFFEAIIKSHNKYSYEEIDLQIQNNTLEHSLEKLYNLTKKFRQKRLLNGYEFDSKEYRLIEDKDENLISVKEEQSTASHQLVEECMLLANVQAASKINNLGIFRVHQEIDIQKLEELLTNLKLLGIKAKLKNNIHSTIESIQQKALNVGLQEEVDQLIIQSQQQAKYAPLKSLHFGLGFESYSHFTSPIRRYSDLVLHRILKTNKIPQDIEQLCENLSNQEREITKLTWDLNERKYARWAINNLDTILDAIIIELDEFAKAMCIGTITGMKCNIINYNGEKLFSKVKIQLLKADLFTKNIECKII